MCSIYNWGSVCAVMITSKGQDVKLDVLGDYGGRRCLLSEFLDGAQGEAMQGKVVRLLEHAEGEYIKWCCHGGERIYSGANAIGGQPREDYMNYEKLFF